MKSKTLLVAAIAALFGITSAYAADDKASPSSASAETTESAFKDLAFKDLDKNSDGSISREEAQGSARERDFDELDKDKDGKLSREAHGAGGASRAESSNTDSAFGASGATPK